MAKRDLMLQDAEMKKLFEEFPELLLEEVNLNKEVFAHFGLLFSGYALLEAALQNCYIFWKLRHLQLNGSAASEEEWLGHHDNFKKKLFLQPLAAY